MEQDGLRDIKPLWDLASLPTVWFYLLVLLVLIVLYFVYKFWKQYKRRTRASTKEIMKSPMEVFDDQVRALRHLTGEGKKFHFPFSECVRLILEHHSKISFTDQTTEELQRTLRNNSCFLQSEVDQILSALKESDLIKFADKVLSKESDEKLLEDFVKLVRTVDTRLNPPKEVK